MDDARITNNHHEDQSMAKKYAPTVREELDATRTRPMDSPMATWNDDSEGEEEAWSGPTGNYQEIKTKIPWELIGLVVWSWFVFMIGRASV